VLVVGLGEVGQWVLELLGRRPEVPSIVAADVSPDRGRYRVNAAMLSTSLEGYRSSISFRQIDVDDIEATARLVAEVKPAVVFSAVALNSWWVLQPTPIRAQLYDDLLKAGFGFLVPWHVTLVAKLARAIDKAGSAAMLVNASYPDVVDHLVKAYVGFDRIVGIGNIDLSAGELRLRAASAEKVPVNEVVVYLAGSHSIIDHNDEDVPFRAKIMVGDKDVTARYDVAGWLADPLTGFTSEAGRKLHVYSFTAASAVKNIMSVLRDTNQLTHCPGPHGLVGGFPVRLGAAGATIALPEGWDEQELIATNAEALHWDGIERIDPDGTIYYTEQTVEILYRHGYDCRPLAYDELEIRAEQLNALTKKWLAE